MAPGQQWEEVLPMSSTMEEETAEAVQGAGDGGSLWPAVDSEAPAGCREQRSAGTAAKEGHGA